MSKEIVRKEYYIISGERGFLKGNGQARYLQWVAAKSASMYTSIKSAQRIINVCKDRPTCNFNLEIVMVEFAVHGTIDEIMEREMLCEN